MHGPTAWLLAFAALGSPTALSQQAASPPSDLELFVKAEAEPGGGGTQESPFASIEEARDVLRIKKGGVITLLGGTFRREQTLEFDQRDSHVRLQVAKGAEVRIMGGAELVSPIFRVTQDNDLLQRLPTEAARASVRVVVLPEWADATGPVQRGMGTPVVPIGSEVFLDGVALTRARWPNTGFADVGHVTDVGTVPRNRAKDVAPEKRETGPERGGRFQPPGVSSEQLARWETATDPWAFGYWFHDWAEELLPIAEVNADEGEVQLGLPHRYGLKSGTSFYVTNLLEELDAPGEYVLDIPGRRLILWPPALAPTDPDPASLVITTLGEPLIRIRGATNFAIVGLTLEDTRGPTIVVEEGDGVIIAACRIARTGTHGIVIEGSNCRVLACDLRDIGATGVDLKGGDRASLRAGSNVLSKTRIHNFGRVYRTYQPAVRVAGVGQRVLHNEFAHAPHSAIIFSGNQHTLLGNEIFDVLRETGDCGAIYCGRDWAMHGTRIKQNFIHHLGGTAGRYQNAIYLDDMASGIEVFGNVIWRCNWGMLVGGGRDLDIHDNTFLECELGIRFDARGVGWMASHIADPKTSTLHQRLAAMPIDEEPWSTLYPSLARYLDDRFGRPVGSRVTGNRLYNTPFGSVVDLECVHVEDNTELEQWPAWLKARDYIESGPALGERRGRGDGLLPSRTVREMLSDEPR